MVIGFSLGKLQSVEEDTLIEKQIITEQPIYYEQSTPQRYFDKNSPSDVYQTLLQDAISHFDFEFDVKNVQQFQEDKDFILANLEHQYSRLAVKFDTEPSSKILVRLVDDINVFKEDLGIDFKVSIASYSAFALGGDQIEIYINPLFTVDKFDIAQTISHELVHLFHYQVNDSNALYNPDWFIEGMAEGFSYPREEPLIHEDIYKAIPDLLTLDYLIRSPNPEDYTIGYDTAELFFIYLVETYGEEKVIQLAKCTTTFDEVFTQQIGVTPDAAYNTWLNTL